MRRSSVWSFSIWLCLLILAAGLWAFSYHSKFLVKLSVQAGESRRELYINRGLVIFFSTHRYLQSEPFAIETGRYPNADSWTANYWKPSWLGFRGDVTLVPFQATLGNDSWAVAANNGAMMPRTLVSIPLWFLTILVALPTARLLVAAVCKRKRLREGMCLHCGYDLRESPQRCPECGTLVSQPSPQA